MHWPPRTHAVVEFSITLSRVVRSTQASTFPPQGPIGRRSGLAAIRRSDETFRPTHADLQQLSNRMDGLARTRQLRRFQRPHTPRTPALHVEPGRWDAICVEHTTQTALFVRGQYPCGLALPTINRITGMHLVGFPVDTN